ncbi:MAG: ribosome-associated translation inhibitor RaiA [Candidatus Neomarinimicrobiota bacterium]
MNGLHGDMQIEVTARHFKAPKQLRDFVTKEVRALNRYFDGILDCRIVLSKDNGQEVAEIIAHSKGHQFTAIEASQKMDRAVILAVEKLKSQMRRYKGKLVEK